MILSNGSFSNSDGGQEEVRVGQGVVSMRFRYAKVSVARGSGMQRFRDKA
jgi:hypothetical protein